MDEARSWRLGVVSYLNARPLCAALEAHPKIELAYDVPARLPALLDNGIVDAALVPVVDLFDERRSWQIVSDACIASDGETLTVRVFSRVPAESICRLYVDGDSHSSVVLARIIWEESYGRTLEVVALSGGEYPSDADAILLIGDKVVSSAPRGYKHQIDLGSAWKSLTAFPFVFAVWASQQGVNVAGLARLLCEARDRGAAEARVIAEQDGPRMGWPAATARHYLTACIRFTLGPRQRAGLERFSTLAKEYGFVSDPRELTYA
ncbi:MAG: menaquinone biosynthetic enzyme MqnA/MqnD family protein [Phycisphaerae bacterium]